MSKKTKILILTTIAILFSISFSNFNVEKVYAAEMLEPIGNVQSALSNRDDMCTGVSLKNVFCSGIKLGEEIYESIFISINGYITFGHTNFGYSPLGIKGYTEGPIVAAQYDDIDLRKGGNIYYYQNIDEGYVVATYKDVPPISRPTGTEVEYPENGFDYNSYQIILRRIGEADSTDFQIEIRYNKLGWARAAINDEWPTAGWSVGDEETYVELPQSGQSNFTDILSGSNIDETKENFGVYRWDVINGIVQSEPTVNETNVYVPSITANSVVLGGNVSNDGGLNITERGIVYSTSPNPTTNDNKIICNAETGSFSTYVTGLSSGTTYYVKAYAINDLGIGYGPQSIFTTKIPTSPIVSDSVAISSITHCSAVIEGNIISDGYKTITERGIVCSTDPNPTISDINDNKIIIYGGTGNFTVIVDGFCQETTYYLKVYAKNSIGIDYSVEKEFTTKKLTSPSISTTSVSSVTHNSAVLEGNVIDDGGADITERGFVYSTNDNPTIYDNKTIVDGKTGSFTTNLNNLVPNTIYNVKAYATNSQGTSFGEKFSFNTLAQVPQITDADISGSNIELTVNSDVNPINTLYYVEASTLDNDFSSPSVVANWTTLNNGKIIFNQSNLSNRDTYYYFRIRAKNDEGILTDYDVNDPASIPSTMYILTLPEKPGELNIVPVSTSEMTISGYNVAKVDSEEITYNIYRDNEIIAEDITDLTYTDSGSHLKPNMNYTYKVEAVNASGASNQSTNTKYTLADKVGQVILKSKNNNSITLNLDKGNNEEEPEYKVIAKEVENELNIIEGVWSSTTVYTLSGLSTDTSYYLYISTRNLDGAESDNTKEIRVLAELGNIRPSNFTCNDITIYSNNSKNNQYAKVGDIVTVRFTLDEYFDLNNDIITASIGGKEANVSFIGSLATANYEYEAAYTMTNTDKEGELEFCINLINENSIELQINAVTDTSKVIFDKTAPTDTNIDINGGAEYTTTKEVSLTISAVEAVEMIISENSDFSGVNWEEYKTNKVLTLSNGDGEKTVYIKFRDEADNITSILGDSIILDTKAPTNTSISINGGAEYTTTKEVTLAISATGASEMMISENSDFSGANWEEYKTDKEFILSDGDGIKTVYIRFKDDAGNETSTTINDTIKLDTEKPTVIITSTEVSPTNVEKIPVLITFNERVIDFELGKIVVGNGTAGNLVKLDEKTYKTDILPSSDGVVTVDIKANVICDSAGNQNFATEQFSIISDKTAPVLTLVGNSEIYIDKDETYVEQGFEVLDNVSGINGSVNITGEVDTSIIDDNTLIYSIEDNAGNLAQTSRTIHVVQPMTLSIEDASNIRLTSATLNAEILNLGAANDLLSYGFVWNETGNPTVNDNKVELTELTVPGTFTYTLNSLSSSEKYYFAAYAKDSTGIRYSETKTLHTNKRYLIPKPITDPLDEDTGETTTGSGINTDTTTESAIGAEDTTTSSAVQLENITEEEKEALTRKTPEEDKKNTEIVGQIVRFIQEADADENEYNERVLTIPITPTSSINADNLVVVLIDEETGEYIPVPAKTNTNDDGSTTVVIKHKGSGVYTVIESNKDYSNITDNHWARETAETMSRKLMLDDVFDNGINLELGITRGQMAGLMVKILGINTNEFELEEEFSDLKQDNKWFKYMSAAVELDIFKGYGDNTVKPEQTITREEMAAVMFRTMEKIKTLAEEQEKGIYQDQENIKSWAVGKVNTLSLLVIFEGYNDGHFKPENNIKIGEALTALYRMGRYLDFVD